MEDKTKSVFQISIVIIISIASIINLSLNNDLQNVWIGLLSVCVGYIIPSPQLKFLKINEQVNIKT